MADRYWVAGSGTWNNTTTTNWSETSGGAGGASVPTSTDNAIFDTSSGFTNSTVVTMASTAVCTDWTVIGPAVKGHAFQLSGNVAGITGSVAINGNSVTNRVFIRSNVLGTARTLTIATLASMSYIDFRDIDAAGAAIPLTGTSIGNCLGNSDITFDAPATQTATGTASFTWSTHGWTSRVPLPQDDVVINNSFVAGRTVTVDMPRMGANIDLSGCTGSPNFTWNIGTEAYGNIALASGVVVGGGTNSCSLAGRGTQTITSNGGNFGSAGTPCRININAFGGSYTLQDTLVQVANGSPSNWLVVAGTFDSNNQTMTVGQLGATATGATCTLGTSTVTLNNSATGNIMNVVAGATMNASTATFIVATGGNRTWTGGGKTYGTVSYTVAGSTGSLTVVNNNTFTTFNFSDASNARSLLLTAGSTQTFTTFNVFGSIGKLITIDTPTAATHTLSKASGIVSSDYLSVKNSIATGGAAWYAGVNSTNVSGNTGWIFTGAVYGSRAGTTYRQAIA